MYNLCKTSLKTLVRNYPLKKKVLKINLSEKSEFSCAVSFDTSEMFKETSKIFLEHSAELLLQSARVTKLQV